MMTYHDMYIYIYIYAHTYIDNNLYISTLMYAIHIQTFFPTPRPVSANVTDYYSQTGCAQYLGNRGLAERPQNVRVVFRIWCQ